MTESPSYARTYLSHVANIANLLNVQDIDNIVGRLLTVRKRRGRLFFVGVGGSAANASHAVNDFRKLADYEAYAPTDNVAELTARTNDKGWETVFVDWLEGSRFNSKDALFVLSVGGGHTTFSKNILNAAKHANEVGASLLGIVGRKDGYLGQHADAAICVPMVDINMVTPHAEEFQSVLLHLIVMHPKIKRANTTW